MFKKHSVTNRIFIWITIGLIYGLVILALAKLLDIHVIRGLFGIWTVLIFVIMWFTIGFVGIFDRHPILKFKMNWWMRGLVAGLTFGLIYTLVWYETITNIMESAFMLKWGFHSPFWAMTDFVLAGLIIAFFETKIAWQGSKLPLK